MCCKHWLPSQRKSYQVQWRIFSSLSGMSGTRKHHVNNNEQWTELWTDNTDKILHQITETESSQRCLTRRYFVSLKISSNTYFCYLNDPHISNEKWCVRLTIKYIMTVSVVMRERLRHKGPTPPPPVLGQRSVSQRDGASPARSVSVVTRVTAMSLSHHKLKFLEVSLWPHWHVSCWLVWSLSQPWGLCTVCVHLYSRSQGDCQET